MTVREFSIKKFPVIMGIFLAVATIAYLISRYIDNIALLPNTLFGEYAWLYWIAIVATVIISTIVLIIKDGFFNGILVLAIMSISNATALVCAQLLSKLLLPRLLYSYFPSKGYEIWGNISLFSLRGTLKSVFIYSPHIAIVVILITSIIYISYRCEFDSFDILFAFLTSLIAATGVLLGIGLLITAVWAVLVLVLLLIGIVIVIIQFILALIVLGIFLGIFCGGCC